MKINGQKVIFFIYSLFGISLFAGLFYFMFFVDIKTSGGVFDIPANAGEMMETTETSEKPAEKTVVFSPKITDVAAKGSAVGKITERYISPYTANTSYKNIYLKNNTELKVDLKSLFLAKTGYHIEKNGSPQVLILHTHATESYMPTSRDYYTNKDVTRSTDNSKNMVAIGEIVTKKLNAKGINTLHSKTQHDYPSYNESYSRAADTICSYKRKYKDLKVVIDIHRDAISDGKTDKIKLTKDINGKPAAQIMLVMGSQSGGVKNFPNYKENLKLAVKIQSKAEQMYPGLARSICLMSKNYNESLTNGSVLIEIGTDANSFEEAKYSAELLGNILCEVLPTL